MTNEILLLDQQIQRESESRATALNRLRSQTKEDEINANSSNTIWGVTLRNHYLGLMISELERQIKEIPLRSGINMGEKYEILQSCTGVRFARKKGQTIVTETDLFDPALACHIALMLSLDASCLPKMSRMDRRTSTNPWLTHRPTKAQLQDKIAKELRKQMHYRLVAMNYPRWMQTKLEQAKGEFGGSSAHYVHNRLDKAIREFRAYLTLQQKDQAAAGLDLGSWSFHQREVVGSWMMSLVWKTGLFKWEDGSNAGGKPDKFLVLSSQGKEIRQSWIDSAESFAFDPLPMLVPPADITNEKLGGWIADGECINGCVTPGYKGRIELSDLHLSFYNHQQHQAFRVNQFVLGFIQEMKERNLQLGSWKFYDRDRVPNPTVAERLGIPAAEFNNLEEQEQKARLTRDREAFSAAKRERSAFTREQDVLVNSGLNSQRLLRLAQRCSSDDRFYLPIQPDFRSRYYPRTSFLSYQSSDTGRALLEFADGYHIDDESRRVLAIHLANCAGFDKVDFDTRINWTESNHQKILAVANMLSNDVSWEKGWNILQEFKDEDVIQLAAAMNEFAQLFLIKSRSHTYLPCSVDATCSGQQILAGQLRSQALAELVNCVPTTAPGDIYRRVMERMLELSVLSELGNFTKKIVQTLKGKAGRAMSKAGFMSGQYGSGTERQLEDMKYKAEELGLKFRTTEWALFTGDKKRKLKSVWEQALEDVTKLRATFNWYKDLAEEVAATGASELLLPLPTGSTIVQQYSQREKTTVETFHYGCTSYRAATVVHEPTGVPELGKWRTATCANQIHGLDASLICLALHDFQFPFYCCHDSCSTYAGKPMDIMGKRLRNAYREVAEFNMWEEVRAANNLPHDPTKAPPVVGTLKLDQVESAQYMFC